jgi:hypothetical protein
MNLKKYQSLQPSQAKIESPTDEIPVDTKVRMPGTGETGTIVGKTFKHYIISIDQKMGEERKFEPKFVERADQVRKKLPFE